jgi:hypothetical protein
MALCQPNNPLIFDELGYCYSQPYGYQGIGEVNNSRRQGYYCDGESESNKFISHIYGNACDKKLRRIGVHCGNKDMGSVGNNKGCYPHDTGNAVKSYEPTDAKYFPYKYRKVPIRYDGGSIMDLIPGPAIDGRKSDLFSCPDGSYVDGLEFISGDWIDGMRFRCRPNPEEFCQKHPMSAYCTKWFESGDGIPTLIEMCKSGSEEEICKKFDSIVAAKPGGGGIMDEFYTKYCEKPENTMDPKCSCINSKLLMRKELQGRGLNDDEIERLVSLVGGGGSSSCWWKPCSDGVSWVRAIDKTPCVKNNICRDDRIFLDGIDGLGEKIIGLDVQSCRTEDTITRKPSVPKETAPLPQAPPRPETKILGMSVPLFIVVALFVFLLIMGLIIAVVLLKKRRAAIPKKKIGGAANQRLGGCCDYGC